MLKIYYFDNKSFVIINIFVIFIYWYEKENPLIIIAVFCMNFKGFSPMKL